MPVDPPSGDGGYDPRHVSRGPRPPNPRDAKQPKYGHQLSENYNRHTSVVVVSDLKFGARLA